MVDTVWSEDEWRVFAEAEARLEGEGRLEGVGARSLRRRAGAGAWEAACRGVRSTAAGVASASQMLLNHGIATGAASGRGGMVGVGG